MKKNWTKKIDISKKVVIEHYDEEAREVIYATFKLNKRDKILIEKLRSGEPGPHADTKFLLRKKTWDFEMVIDPNHFTFNNSSISHREISTTSESWKKNKVFTIAFYRYR